MRKRLSVVAASFALLAGTLGGCSGQPTAGPSSTQSLAPAASGNVEIPIKYVNVGGTPRLVTTVVVGGGPPTTVVLDTGSSGLWLSSDAVGPQATNTDQQLSNTYSGGQTFSGTLAKAPVQIGNVTTDGPIGVVPIAASNFPADFGGQGLMGISLQSVPGEQGTGSSAVYSPLLQTNPSYTWMKISASSSGTGTLTLGVGTPPSGSTVSLASLPPYPNGVRNWQSQGMPLCWTVKGTTVCGPTDVDSGTTQTRLTFSQFPGVQPTSEGNLAPGVPISVSATKGQIPLYSFTSGAADSADLVTATVSGASDIGNTGIKAFLEQAVTFDWLNGTATFSSQ